MKNEKRFYTYMYFDPSKNEPIYIGKGQGNRLRYHLKRLDNSHFANRLRKMKTEGIEPIISKIIENVDASTALRVEMELIEKYGRRDLGTGPLLNMTCGGDGVVNMSQETRAKIGKSNKGKTLGIKLSQQRCEEMSKARKGLKKSEDHKKSIAIALTGLAKTEEHINKINKNPEKIRKMAEKHRGMKRSEETRRKISEKAKMRTTSTKGRVFYYDLKTLEVICSHKDDIPPEGYIRGNPNIRGANRGIEKEWWHDPSNRISKKLPKEGEKPEGWKIGKIKKGI